MHRGFALLVFASLAACNGSVFIGPGTTGEGGAGGMGGATTTTTTTTSTTTTTTTTTTTSSTTTVGPMCGVTHDSFHASLETPFEGTFDCYLEDVPAPADITLRGVVVDNSNGTIVFDTCSPAVDCFGINGRLSVDAPGFYTHLPIGAFIEVRFEIEPAWLGCIHRVTVVNLPSWDGFANPAASDKRLWLAGSEGYQDAMPGAPFSIEAVPLGCGYPNESCAVHEDYQWRFTSPGDPNGMLVPMGATTSWWNGDAVYQVKNLKSFSSGYCDDYWNWAYWMTEMPPPK